MPALPFKALSADLSRLFIPPRAFADNGTEQRFLSDYARQNLSQRRLFMIIALGLWVAFTYWDYHHRYHHPTVISAQRFGAILAWRAVGTLLIGAGIALAWSERFLEEKHAARTIMALVISINGCLTAMMSTLPAPLNYQYYFVGIVLVLFFQYGTMALLTRCSVLATLAPVLMLLVQDWLHHPLDIYFFPAMFYLVAFATLGLAVSVRFERAARERFSQLLALNSNYQQLQEANLSMRREKQKTDAAQQELFRNEFLKAQALSEKTEATARFVRATYHDTLQPLTSIAVLAHAGQQASDGGRGAEVAPILRSIATAAREINLLFKGLRDVFMIGEREPQLAPVSLNRLLAELQQVHAPRAQEKHLQLRVVARRQDILIHTDAALMMRVLGNLVGNAIKYTEHGGVLVGSVSAKTVLRIDVVDTGVGIAPAYGQRIFEEFFQVNNPSRDKANGLGLGLYIVRNFIGKLPGHRLSFASRPGQGSRFSVDCPVADAHPPRVEAPCPASALAGLGALAGAYLMVVEDDPHVLASLERLLAPLGCLVHSAASLEALQALLERAPDRHPDLLITDYKLEPGASGLDVVRQVREHFAWAQVPVLVYSAELAQNLVSDLPLATFVAKGEEPALLLRQVQALVGAGRVANEGALLDNSTPTT